MFETQALMQTLWNNTAGPEFVELRKAVATWLKHVLLPRALPDINLSTVDELLEIKDMIDEHSRSWSRQWKADGVREGKIEGIREGTSAVLLRLLQRKFGALTPHIQERLDQATADQLEAWSLNVLDATSLDEVFKD